MATQTSRGIKEVKLPISSIDGYVDISTKADKTNVLEKDNTTVFTPTADYHPATKKYVDDNGGSFAGDMDDIDDGATYVKTENNLTDALVSAWNGKSDFANDGTEYLDVKGFLSYDASGNVVTALRDEEGEYVFGALGVKSGNCEVTLGDYGASGNEASIIVRCGQSDASLIDLNASEIDFNNATITNFSGGLTSAQALTIGLL